MKIALVQSKPTFLDLEKNLQRATEILENIAADIAVFPELFLSGYTFSHDDQVRSCAFPFAEGPQLAPLLKISRKKSMAVCGGYAELHGRDLYNSAFCMIDGQLKHNYRKVHLFNREKLFFKPGNQGFKVFDFRGATLGMMICFDWLFPEAARSLALQGAQVILHPANLVLPFCQQAMFARALENRVFIVTVNRVGTETTTAESNAFTGQSQVVSPTGEYLIRMAPDQDQVEILNIDPAQALEKHITPLNHVMQDRRKEEYTL
jgi:predicted amidohydrolase